MALDLDGTLAEDDHLAGPATAAIKASPDAPGGQAAISKSAVSTVCQAIKDEYGACARRRLDQITLDYLFLAPGAGESTDACHGFLQDLKDRELASPLLVISDGAPGLIAAVEQAYPQALRQRCLIHRARNVLAKVPAGMQAELKDAYWKIFDTEDLKTPPGPRLAELIDARISEMAARYSATYPPAMKRLTTDKDGLTAYLRFPAEHHHRIRHSNFIERTFGETRRRVKVIGRLPGETSCLTLVWAVLDRASRGWRGMNMTSDGLRLLQDLRRSLLEPPRQLRPRTVTTSQPADGRETVSTVA